VADFHDQQTALVQIPGRLRQQASYDIKPIVAAGERNGRLGTVFRRQTRHCVLIYVRRV